MKAIGYYTPGPIDRADALVDLDLPMPVPGPRDLRVEVKAISVNPVDVKVRATAQPEAGQPRILGWDAAGIVEAVGAEVSLFRPGDAVWYAGDITRPGTNAAFALVDERIAALKPARLGWEDAAALPLTAITAWELLFTRLGVPYGRKTGGGTLLVVNGAGGVGSILIQLARRLTGLTIIATASRPDSVDWVRRMGAHHVINHHAPLDAQLEALGHREVELVASLTGSERQLAYYPALIAPQGRLALIDDPARFDIVPFKRKSISVHWELMFTRPMFATADMIEQHRLLSEVAALVDEGLIVSTRREVLRPISAATLKLAHARQESASAIGKTVLAGFED
ncbi:zinc-binding alcohol dehydrogenase family protein [Xanthobacter sp. V4C-4]|uniref:zinc-binding alcohol dehydrogenase family protein n=1 Tax=Xanthobacter cornucopiae TaxID=3119924 RepID=UPI0037269429